MKTAEELGIAQEELDALIEVRRGLADGCMVHYNKPRKDEEDRDQFNMNSAGSYDCGTVACIGGWMYMILRPRKIMSPDDAAFELETSEYVFNHKALEKLFYPYAFDGTGRWQDITPEVAVKAIDNFLKTGDPDWESLR